MVKMFFDELRTLFSFMEQLPVITASYSFGPQYIELCLPDPSVIRFQYDAQKATQQDLLPPYWARIWPSAIAMSEFLLDHSSLIFDKKVLELAAGLGLPALVAARYAREVIVSDYIPEALDFQQRSIDLNKLKNVHPLLLDWRERPAPLQAELVLLSDSNYDPQNQELLLAVIHQMLERGCKIILSTPQRLLSRSFIRELLPNCTSQEEKTVAEDAGQVTISLLVLEAS